MCEREFGLGFCFRSVLVWRLEFNESVREEFEFKRSRYIGSEHTRETECIEQRSSL